MKNRFFTEENPSLYYSEANLKNPRYFSVLNGDDVISAQVSDHHPIIHHGVLFWNVMMRCDKRASGGFNNAFGLIESEKEYLKRLSKISMVIAEIIAKNPSVEAITLCEGPNQLFHQKILFDSLKKFASLRRFLINNGFYQPDLASDSINWGLLMLADHSYNVKKIKCQFSSFSKIRNRLQIWKFTRLGRDCYLGLAHFPFRNDENVTEKALLSRESQKYNSLINQLLNKYASKSFIFCADFNSNPYLINHYQDRVLDQIPHYNSVLFKQAESKNEHSSEGVTVDGILLSLHEKQKNFSSHRHPWLFERLKWQYSFFKSYQTIFPLTDKTRLLSRKKNAIEKISQLLKFKVG